MGSRIGLMLAVGVLAAAPVAAHHGAGVFEPEKKITVEGTVTDFQFVNPHVLVYMTVKGEGGKDVQWGGELTSPNRLARDARAVKWHKEILKPGDRITIRARSDARFMMLGGEPMDGPRFIWWNFVSSRQDRIEQAKADWKAARFDTVPGDEAEFIPLPELEPQPVRYP